MVMAMDVEMAPARLRRLASWLLGQASLEAQRVGSAKLGAVGASRQQYALLAALEETGAASQADLGRRLGVDPGDMVRLVAAMATSGWLGRSRDPVDRRRRLVTITAAGRRRLRRLDGVVAEIQDELLAPLTSDERRNVTGLLSKIVQHRHVQRD